MLDGNEKIAGVPPMNPSNINKLLNGSKDMVNHPSHYEKGNGHMECIDLLEELCSGYFGIAAMEIGQFKYLYRCGSKGDSALSVKEKAIEDISKVIWYMKNLYAKARTSVARDTSSITIPTALLGNQKEMLPDEFRCHKDGNKLALETIVREFTYDKPEFAKGLYREVLTFAYNLRTYDQLSMLIQTLEMLKKAYEENFLNNGIGA